MIIIEIILLKPKCYSFKVVDREGRPKTTKRTLKGISVKTAYREEIVEGKVVKKPISIDDYRKALFDPLVPSKNPKDKELQIPVQRHIVHRITSSKQELKLIKQNKISLSRSYDKRVVAEDDIHTFAYGYNPLPL